MSTETTDPVPESTLGGGSFEDSVAAFAASLRQLRLDADSPTLSHLQTLTGISKSSLSDAFAGRVLPSARTVDRVVRACGADPRPWVARRDALIGPRADESGVLPNESPARKGVSRATLVWVTAAALLLGVAGGATGAVIAGSVRDAGVVAEESGPSIDVESGEDPAMTKCVDDARVATGDTRADNSLLEIVWSDACQAGWGRITRYDGLYQGNTVTIAIYPQTAPDGPDRQEATEHDVQGAYTTLVVRPSEDTLLCAEGSFTVDGKRIDLGDPLCI